ncbi:MAG TPA: bifunctional hydroxymethylpyrimidine kinase/phosphomethylpyrimidine kinase [Planococcus sp. (in: firmicutes)]|nr:bifunctional hydroxymethylpyrimidine kinase/phosphomethylpyrimidine kinase [Planococcus sp. (in: firmicutes)]
MSSIQVLTIAGSDSGGGAGIQADIKTFQELGVFGTSAITAVTAQNTLGVHAIYPMDAEAVRAQLDAIGSDFSITAVKTGMLFNKEIIEETAKGIRKYRWTNLVIDPVMIAKGGASLLQQEAVDAVKEHLLPLASVVTPNIPEAEAISGMEIRTIEDRERAAREIMSFGAGAIIIKGGHGSDPEFTEDYFLDRSGESSIFRSRRIDTQQSHGTGCTFAAAIAAELGKGESMKASIYTAKSFIQAALCTPLNIGAGHGPTNHAAYRRGLRSENEVNKIEVF